jgi:hypothetical protein
MIEKFRKRMPNQKFSKITLFRNPNEFSSMYIEKVNPNHHGIIWGRRRKDLKKGTAYIRAGEIWFSIVIGSVTVTNAVWVSFITGYVFEIMAKVSLLTGCVCFLLAVMLYYMPFKLQEVKPNGNRNIDLFGRNRLGIILQ